MRRQINRALNALELGAVLLAGKLLGLGWVVRYLRNPNPAQPIRALDLEGTA